MTIVNLGSINVDYVYGVERIARPGETIAAKSFSRGLGGKGANQSIAAAMAGAAVRHVGAVGADGEWTVERLAAAGVDTADIARIEAATGHAIIEVDAAGENVIVIWGGANRALARDHVEDAIARAAPGDWLLLQNETSMGAEAVAAGRARGLKVCYSAAPFSAAATAALIADVDIVAVNESEAGLLADHYGGSLAAVPAAALLITRGAEGATYRTAAAEIAVPAVKPERIVDTTGAGDTFLGYFLAALDIEMPVEAALRRAAAAAALQIQKPGAADAIPTAAEVDALLLRA